jgi:hypothetical protein
MSQQLAHRERKRKYTSTDPKRASLIDKIRVFVPGHATRTDVEKDPAKKHQSRNGGVFKFVPQPEQYCCKRLCLSYFDREDDPAVHEARAPLYDRNLSVIERRERYNLSLFVMLILFYYYFVMTGLLRTGTTSSMLAGRLPNQFVWLPCALFTHVRARSFTQTSEFSKQEHRPTRIAPPRTCRSPPGSRAC